MRLIFLCLFFSVAFFQGLPVPNSDKEFTVAKGIVWNKWETDNFVILSIDFEFGKKLKSRVEKMKSEFFHSFGLRDNNLPVKCKIVCVPDPSILKKFFSLESPKYELRKDESGEIDEIAIWIDESRFDELPFLVASSCLLDSPEFISKGLPSLVYLSPSKISELIQSSEGTLNLDSDSTLGHSLLACLFFRKEFGSANFSRIVSGQVPWVVCGFSDKESLVSSLERYSSNLKLDLKYGKTPNYYLKLVP